VCISGGWPGWRTFRQAGWSADERFLTIIGNGTNATASRTIARIDTLGWIDSSTRFSAAGVSPRSVVTTAGTDLWWSGDTGSGSTEGIRFTSLGSSSSGVATDDGWRWGVKQKLKHCAKRACNLWHWQGLLSPKSFSA
jgi:hypothetical protein